jgi:hypothetical protein
LKIAAVREDAERERRSEEVGEVRDGEGRKSGNKRLLVEREAGRSP